MKLWTLTLSSALLGAALILAGCSHQQPVTMAPPTYPAQGYNGQMAPPMNASMGNNGGMQNGMPGGQNNVYSWTDVPVGQQVPIIRAVFDQGGYQLFAQSGETIVVPFANQNMYVMKFGQTGNGMYFVNDGQAPTLYVPVGGSLENAAAQGARWYPFPQNYNYSAPVYVGIAPSWSQFVGMGWYPGMSYYGGYWGYHPYGIGASFLPMAGLYFNIGGRPYYGWNSYNSYYRANPNYVRVRTVYNNYSSFGNGRSNASFGRSSGFGSSAKGSTGSFGSGRQSSFGGSSSGSSFGRSSGTGSFGSGSTSTRSFGSGNTSSFGSNRSTSSGSFGSGSSGFGSSSRSGSGSFGSGSSGYRSGGSFGGSSSGHSSSGGSFGGGRSSGSSFGGGRSSGGSFGGGRRR